MYYNPVNNAMVIDKVILFFIASFINDDKHISIL